MVKFYWNPWALTGLCASLLAWSFALFVWKNSSGKSDSKRLAVLLFVEGFPVFLSGACWTLIAGTKEMQIGGLQLLVAADYLSLALYLPFLAAALDLRLLQIFRKRSVRLTLLVLAFFGIMS